jgi:hypothetical protein
MPLIVNTISMLVSLALLVLTFKVQNYLVPSNPAQMIFILKDLTLGAVGYFKTSLEFVIIVGMLFYLFDTPTRKAVSAAAVTVGNTLGTIIVVIITFVSNVLSPGIQPIITIVLLLVGSLVLIKMARESILHIEDKDYLPQWLNHGIMSSKHYIMPKVGLSHKEEEEEEAEVLSNGAKLTLLTIAVTSFYKPFALGLDDMAVYISLINMYSAFSICFSIIVSHWVLTSAMLLTPQLKKVFGYDPVKLLIEDPIFTIVGIGLFVAIGIHGFIEIAHLLMTVFGHH